MQAPRKTTGEWLQSLPKPILYLILIVLTTVPLFVTMPVPNTPSPEATDLYRNLMSLPDGSRVLLASDWTGSTRGESRGEFVAILRILMRKHVKFALLSTGDSQAPRVAMDVIAMMNKELKDQGQPEYVRFTDWVNLGYFPNSEAALNGIVNNITAAFGSKKDFPPGKPPTDVFQSPVLQGIDNVTDFPMWITVTASNTSVFTVQRASGKLPLAMAVTGVMGPETGVYYQSGQIVGYAAGLKGVYDLETLMETGVPKDQKHEAVPGFKGMPNKGQGSAYYPTLHFAMGLMVLMVIIGNLGMVLSRGRGNR